MSTTSLSYLSNSAAAIPNGLLFAFAASGIALGGFVLRAVLPTPLIKSLDASLSEADRLCQVQSDTFETRLFSHLGGESDVDVKLAHRLIVLQDHAARLRMQTLFHGTFFVRWGELWGLCTGLSFSIWYCTRKIQCLSSEMQMRQQEKLDALYKQLTIGTPAVWQLKMRQMHYYQNPEVGTHGGWSSAYAVDSRGGLKI
ncbi:hypothetical protein C8R46DRAFT_1346764 [Mycena filopes]|nr:hypothetical protein C8R46DRAFT_1346764 [Mycena filopes]